MELGGGAGQGEGGGGEADGRPSALRNKPFIHSSGRL